MRALITGSALLASLLLASCSCNSHELDAGPGELDSGQDACALCPVCDDTIQLRISGVGLRAEDVQVAGVNLMCEMAGGLVYCFTRDVAPGMYELTITAPGFMDQQLFFDVDPPLDPMDCCSCPSTFSMLITLAPE